VPGCEAGEFFDADTDFCVPANPVESALGDPDFDDTPEPTDSPTLPETREPTNSPTLPETQEPTSSPTLSMTQEDTSFVEAQEDTSDMDTATIEATYLFTTPELSFVEGQGSPLGLCQGACFPPFLVLNSAKNL
jgi:hypothetical protein